MNARVLIVTQEKPLLAAALVASHDVDTGVLAAAIVLQALVHIWRGRSLSLCFCDCFTHRPTYHLPCPAAQGLLLSRDGEVSRQVLASQKLSELKPVGPQVINPALMV